MSVTSFDAKASKTYRVDEKVDVADFDSSERYQVLYEADGLLHVMHTETFEQIEVPAEMLGESAKFARPGLEVTAFYFEGFMALVRLPKTAEFVVEHTEEKNTKRVKAGTKPAKLMDVDVTIRVPIYMEEGDRVEVSLEDAKFVKRIS